MRTNLRFACDNCGRHLFTVRNVLSEEEAEKKGLVPLSPWISKNSLSGIEALVLRKKKIGRSGRIVEKSDKRWLSLSIKIKPTKRWR